MSAVSTECYKTSKRGTGREKSVNCLRLIKDSRKKRFGAEETAHLKGKCAWHNENQESQTVSASRIRGSCLGHCLPLQTGYVSTRLILLGTSLNCSPACLAVQCGHGLSCRQCGMRVSLPSACSHHHPAPFRSFPFCQLFSASDALLSLTATFYLATFPFRFQFKLHPVVETFPATI